MLYREPFLDYFSMNQLQLPCPAVSETSSRVVSESLAGDCLLFLCVYEVENLVLVDTG